MKKILFPLIRVVVLLAYMIAAQSLINWAIAYKNQNYQAAPAFLCLAVASILLGALLRSDVFFQRPVAFHVDWPSLLIIGIPSLLLAFGTWIFMTFPSNVALPGFVGTLLFQNYTPVFGGIIFGYTLINGLFGGQKRGPLPSSSPVIVGGERQKIL